MPVNGRSATRIETYVRAYHGTGDKIYLAKAKDLANTVLAVQKMHDGEFATFLTLAPADQQSEDINNVRINCAQHVAKALHDSLGRY
jgi:hypothetical protein